MVARALACPDGADGPREPRIAAAAVGVDGGRRVGVRPEAGDGGERPGRALSGAAVPRVAGAVVVRRAAVPDTPAKINGRVAPEEGPRRPSDVAPLTVVTRAAPTTQVAGAPVAIGPVVARAMPAFARRLRPVLTFLGWPAPRRREGVRAELARVQEAVVAVRLPVTRRPRVGRAPRPEIAPMLRHRAAGRGRRVAEVKSVDPNPDVVIARPGRVMVAVGGA